MNPEEAVNLSEFLLARIAEDEAMARAASPGPWHVDTESATVLAVDDIEVCDGFALSGPQLRATTRHIAHWDPARVLAECDAKRRTLALLDEVNEQGIPRLTIYTRDLLPRLLALPYADHPDFREEWRP